MCYSVMNRIIKERKEREGHAEMIEKLYEHVDKLMEKQYGELRVVKKNSKFRVESTDSVQFEF